MLRRLTKWERRRKKKQYECFNGKIVWDWRAIDKIPNLNQLFKSESTMILVNRFHKSIHWFVVIAYKSWMGIKLRQKKKLVWDGFVFNFFYFPIQLLLIFSFSVFMMSMQSGYLFSSTWYTHLQCIDHLLSHETLESRSFNTYDDSYMYMKELHTHYENTGGISYYELAKWWIRFLCVCNGKKNDERNKDKKKTSSWIHCGDLHITKK